MISAAAASSSASSPSSRASRSGTISGPATRTLEQRTAEAGCDRSIAAGAARPPRATRPRGNPRADLADILTAGKRRVPWYGIALGAPMLLWQLLFFAFPLLFLIALSF